MTDETKAEAQAIEQVDESEKDWKAEYEKMRTHSRDWEKKAKANEKAADELEKLKAAQMTEQEKAIARAEAAENELAALKAEQARTDAALKISNETGVPLEMLLYCSDEEAMTEFAQKFAEQTHVSSAPTSLNSKRIIRSDSDKKPTNGELFADFAEGFFK